MFSATAHVVRLVVVLQVSVSSLILILAWELDALIYFIEDWLFLRDPSWIYSILGYVSWLIDWNGLLSLSRSCSERNWSLGNQYMFTDQWRLFFLVPPIAIARLLHWTWSLLYIINARFEVESVHFHFTFFSHLVWFFHLISSFNCFNKIIDLQQNIIKSCFYFHVLLTLRSYETLVWSHRSLFFHIYWRGGNNTSRGNYFLGCIFNFSIIWFD